MGERGGTGVVYWRVTFSFEVVDSSKRKKDISKTKKHLWIFTFCVYHNVVVPDPS